MFKWENVAENSQEQIAMNFNFLLDIKEQDANINC